VKQLKGWSSGNNPFRARQVNLTFGVGLADMQAHSGDFARVLYHEIAARSTVEEGQLSLEAVNSLLDQLATGRLKQGEYVPILRKINQQCTAVEQEWIVRIILKGMPICRTGADWTDVRFANINSRERGVCVFPSGCWRFIQCLLGSQASMLDIV
jgi:hypothetical protein